MTNKTLFSVTACIILILFNQFCALPHLELKRNLGRHAPDSFKVIFKTTQGDFYVKVWRKYAPLGVDRFYQLVTSHYFSNAPLYRIIPNFVAQFGSIDSIMIRFLDSHCIQDEDVKFSNYKHTISYARGGPNTRSSQFYINLKDNLRLDTTNYLKVRGFPAFGYVYQGADVLEKFYSYGNYPNKVIDSLKNPKEFFKNTFPKMDYIIKAHIIRAAHAKQ
ncbi:MAG: peptidylprolyl isomerase [Alphaproteobacteria bacterium]|nr:peptidylprolyl isomerase [Alphaproteobacteria bacterium]